jgi:Gluconate 2-dehydrogenase subunit 3
MSKQSSGAGGHRREPRSGSPAGARRRGAPDDAHGGESLSRREMIAAAAAALATPLLAGCEAKAPPAERLAGGFLSRDEMALLDELTELIIPADDHSGGARAAGVAAYIDGRLAESLEPDWQATWRSGLAGVEALSRQLNGKAFLQATPDQRGAVLTQMAAKEGFFHELKWWTVRSYYTSKIGIHVDQEYKGNVYQQGEYAGYDPT